MRVCGVVPISLTQPQPTIGMAANPDLAVNLEPDPDPLPSASGCVCDAGLVAALRLSALALVASIAIQRLLRVTAPLGLVSGYAVLLQTGALVAFLFQTGA